MDNPTKKQTKTKVFLTREQLVDMMIEFLRDVPNGVLAAQKWGIHHSTYCAWMGNMDLRKRSSLTPRGLMLRQRFLNGQTIEVRRDLMQALNRYRAGAEVWPAVTPVNETAPVTEPEQPTQEEPAPQEAPKEPEQKELELPSPDELSAEQVANFLSRLTPEQLDQLLYAVYMARMNRDLKALAQSKVQGG